MIFASDLDQTLIYSIRSRRLQEGQPIPSMSIVEMRDERIISYMTDRAIDLLKQVSEQMVFLPVTTRTIDQYRNISLFQKEIVPPFAVTSNGGNILNNGQIDEQWKRHIQNQLEDHSLSRGDLLKEFSELTNEEWVISERTADELFHYCVINREKAPLAELAEFKLFLHEQGWNMSLQGRKLYFVPKSVNKWDAVAFVKERMGKTFVAAAGDSLLDLCMLEVADYAVAPLHGELNELATIENSHKIHRTKYEGITAAEDILEQVLQVYEKQHINK